jgi:hypothetical protein
MKQNPNTFYILAFSLFLIALFFSEFNVQKAYAHVLQTSGSIGAVLHIDPDDDPVAKKPSTFFLEFKDKNNQLSKESCSCQINITQNGKLLFSQNLFDNYKDNTATFSYTFPEMGQYVLDISGQPTQTKSIKQFNLKYALDIDGEANPNPLNSPAAAIPTGNTQNLLDWIKAHIVYGVGGLIFIGILGSYFVKQSKKNSEEKNNSGDNTY